MGKFSLRARRPRPSLSPSPFRPSYTSHKIGTAAVERPSIVGVTPQTAPTVQRALKESVLASFRGTTLSSETARPAEAASAEANKAVRGLFREEPLRPPCCPCHCRHIRGRRC